MPISGKVLEASPESPYLACALRIDTTILAELLLTMPKQPHRYARPAPSGRCVTPPHR
nr:AraC family transcriptional regulator N-terminal domain-containing protein [Halomonas populi]